MAAFGVTVNEACLFSITYQDDSAGACPVVITRTFTATDSCGNVGTDTQTFTFGDTTAPVIACPANLDILCSPTTDLLAEINTWIALATATDNCDTEVDITTNFDPNNLPELCGDPITITFTAIDDCGNSATCSANVSLDDIEKPIINETPLILTLFV